MTTAESGAEVPLAPLDGRVRFVLRLVGGGSAPSVIDVVAEPDGEESKRVRLQLSANVLEGRLPAARRYSFSFTVDGTESDQHRYRDFDVPADGVLSLDLLPVVRPTIDVVDAATSSPVARSIAKSITYMEERLFSKEVPGDSGDELGERTAVAGNSQGRIELPPTTTPKRWFVGGDGYAWKLVEIPLAGPTRVALNPGGGVRVEVVGFADLENARVVITRPQPPRDPAKPLLPGFGDRNPDESIRDVAMPPSGAPGHFELDGLPPGRWKVVVGREGDFSIGEVYGESEVDVSPGRTVEVVVAPTRATKRSLADVDVEIVVPPGWETVGSTVSLEGVGSKNGDVMHGAPLLGAPPASLRAHLTGLVPGAYELSVSFTRWKCRVHVGLAGGPLRVTIPAPATVRTRVLDENGGATVPDAEVWVSYAEPPDALPGENATVESAASQGEPSESLRGWFSIPARVKYDASANQFSMRLAAGRISISASAPGWVYGSSLLDLAPSSTRDVEIRLRRGATIDVRIVRGAATALDAKGDVTCSQGSGDERASTTHRVTDGVARFDSLSGGTYDVSWTPAEGISPIVRHVTVAAGERAKVDLEVPR